MTSAEFRKICRQRIQPYWPETFYHRSMLVNLPIADIISGVLIEQTGRSDENYVWSFGALLCVPRDSLSLNYGRRLEPRLTVGTWHFSDPRFSRQLQIQTLIQALLKEALPDSLRRRNLECFHEDHMLNWSNTKIDVLNAELVAYSALLLGNLSVAANIIEGALKTSTLRERTWRPKPQFSIACEDRLRSILHLMGKDESLALMQLSEWRTFTLDQLGIPQSMK